MQTQLQYENCINQLLKLFQYSWNNKSKNVSKENLQSMKMYEKLLKRVQTQDFISMAEISKYTDKNIFEVFVTKREEWKEMWENQYYRNKKTREFRDQFSAKMKTIVSERDWIEFFEYTSFERLIENKKPKEWERKYALYISVPLKEARSKDEKIWHTHIEAYIKKFKTFWWFFRKSRDAYSEIDVDEIDVIWEIKFNDGLFEERERWLKKLEYMRPREDPLLWRHWQVILFDSLSFDKLRSDSVAKENIIEHSWNAQAIHWLNYRLSSQEINIDIPTIPNTLIYSKWSWMWKQCLVNRAKNWFREMFPNANVREMTGLKLYQIYSAA